jgi:hypothetical protein
MRWLILTAIVGGLAGAVFLLRARSGTKRLDVGALSDQWVAQHRADQPHL